VVWGKYYGSGDGYVFLAKDDEFAIITPEAESGISSYYIE
jgi:hypothetical protein